MLWLGLGQVLWLGLGVAQGVVVRVRCCSGYG